MSVSMWPMTWHRVLAQCLLEETYRLVYPNLHLMLASLLCYPNEVAV